MIEINKNIFDISPQKDESIVITTNNVINSRGEFIPIIMNFHGIYISSFETVLKTYNKFLKPAILENVDMASRWIVDLNLLKTN